MSLFDGTRRQGCPRPLLPALALLLTAGVCPAAAQTVVVRSAPPGSTIELTMNGGSAVSATADATGDATLAVPTTAAETDVRLHVDECGTLVRVLVVAAGVQPTAAAPGCTRTDLASVFVMRSVTTFVVDVGGPNTAVHLTQGPAPPEWVTRGALPRRGGLPWGTPRNGLALSAGSGFSSFSNAGAAQCGSVTGCSSDTFGLGVSFGAEYWIKPFVAAEVGYVKPADVTVTGSGDGFRFESHQQTRLLTIGGKVGLPKGPVRFYGRGGINRHEATFTSTNTIDDSTVTVDGVTRVVTGGTQAFAQKTTGWSWQVGGGAEAWLAKWVAIYGDLTRLKIKGDPETGDGTLDDSITSIAVGVRFQFGR